MWAGSVQWEGVKIHVRNVFGTLRMLLPSSQGWETPLQSHCFLLCPQQPCQEQVLGTEARCRH